MKLSDVIGRLDVTQTATAALLLFIAVFAVVGVRLLLARGRNEWDEAARLPLEDGCGSSEVRS